MTEENKTKSMGKGFSGQKKVYISGKTSSIDIEEVKIKFKKAESYLIERGMKPVNPLKNGCNENHSQKEHLIKDLEMLLNSDSILVLDEWIDSRQSEIELKIAEKYGISIIFEHNADMNMHKIQNIKFAIKEVMGLDFSVYTTKSRNQKLFYARIILMNFCREREKMSLHDIAKLINRDYTTILHGLKTFKNELKYNIAFRENVSKIDSILSNCVSE